MITESSTIATTERSGLGRGLDSFGFFALAFGSMIGVGWVTAMGGWLTHAGPAGAILAFLAGGTIMLAIGLCYAELTPMLPVAGGEVAYAYGASGTRSAFVVGWFLAFGYISVSAFEAISIGRVLAYLLPGLDRWPLYTIAGAPVYLTHLLLAIVCTAGITALNWIGVAQAGAFQKWLTAAFIAAAILFVGAGLSRGDFQHARPFFAGTGGASTLAGILAVFVTVPFWFVGFDTIPQGAEEATLSVPLRRLGTMIVASIIAATLFYATLIASVALSGPWQGIAASDLPTARAFELAFSSRGWTSLVLVAAIIGLLTSWNGFFLAASRVLFSLGRGGIISQWFGATHEKHATPHRAVLFTGLVTMVAPLLGRNALLAFVDVGSFCIGIAFFGVSLSVVRLRRLRPDLARPYRVPGGAVIPGIAATGALFILAVMIVPGSPAALRWPLEVAILGGFTILGFVFWTGAARMRTKIPDAERGRLILERYALEGDTGGTGL
jgi:basic amino acid/polyamine antiporter, APA family